MTLAVLVESVPAKKPCNMPILAGRKVALGLACALTQALMTSNDNLTKDLLKCSLSVTMRMHMGLSTEEKSA